VLAIPILVRPLHAISRELGAWTIDIARMHAARCLFDVARDTWSLRKGYSAKKAETGTLPVGARDPDKVQPSPCYWHVAWGLGYPLCTKPRGGMSHAVA